MSDQPPDDVPPPDPTVQKNLHGFLHPGQSQAPGAPPTASQLRMAQMELANRMRLKGQSGAGVPISRKSPTGGFGSAQGILQLRRGQFGKSIAPPPISPFDKNNSVPPSAAASTPAPTPPPRPAGPSQAEEVIEVPPEAEFQVGEENPKRPRGKRFKNPKL